MNTKKRQFSGSPRQEVSAREIRNRKIALHAAEEGIVVLRNEGILPISRKQNIALFGGGAVCTIKGGTGSGDVCERYAVSVYDGMLAKGFSICNQSWLEDYKELWTNKRLEWRDHILQLAECGGEHKFFDVYAANPFRIPEEKEIPPEICDTADVILYVISRQAGEGLDRRLVPGDYYLSDREKTNLEILCQHHDNIVILINSGAQIDLKELLKAPQIKGIVYIGQPGMEGGHAVANILSGDTTPSGKLTDTWALDYEDFPGANQFGYLNPESLDEVYAEGIFVGYRYFDAFSKKPAFPFGFGLSYTTFSIKMTDVRLQQDSLHMQVCVKNTGSTFSGKEVVEVYVSCPQTTQKEIKKLCAFQKTKELRPSEEEVLHLVCHLEDMAYFETEQHAWVLDPGDYYILIGNASDTAFVAAVLSIKNRVVVKHTSTISLCDDALSEEFSPSQETLEDFRQLFARDAAENGVPVLQCDEVVFEKPSYPVSEYQRMADEIVQKLSVKQLAAMCVGEISKGHDVALGAAGIMVPGAAGETSSALEDAFDIPGISMADGPAGLRLIKEYYADPVNHTVYTNGILGALENGLFLKDVQKNEDWDTYYQYCTAFPVGVMLAQTWNPEMLRSVGCAVGNEMVEFGISLWLAPGMNIHRNPLCGRNFEYFSEDPFLTGKTAVAITRGVQSLPGVGTTIKHFACNNLEDHRMQSNSVLSERTLREIYLRGFEIAVHDAQPMAVMTSYNLINGVHTANAKDLCTEILRKDWGFQGIVMTDWTTTGSDGGSIPYLCTAAGNDLIMPGIKEDAQNIEEAVQSGMLSIEQLRLCVSRLLTVIFQTLAYEDAKPYQFTRSHDSFN